ELKISNQTQPLGRSLEVLVAPESLFACGPIGPLAQPAKVKVDPGGVQRPFEIGWRTVGPAGALVLLFTFVGDVSAPVFAFRESRQINLAGTNGSGFPIHHEQFAAPHQHGFGVELTVDYGWTRVQQRSEPPITTSLEPGQPGKVFPQGLRKLKHPPGPSAVILGVITFEER